MKDVKFCAAVAAVLATTSAHAATFLVNKADDNGGKHTLRWAIEQSNAINLSNPEGGNRILIAPAYAGNKPFVIQPRGDFLPPLVGPVVVEAVPAEPLSKDSPAAIILDGSQLVPPRTPSACPGATHTYDFTRGAWDISRVSGQGPNVRGYYGAGLAVHDSQDVEIRGFEIRNFCLGVVALRSNNVNIHHMRIVDHHGAAGVIFTGDNGDAGVTDLSFNNRLADSILLDNGDGFEFTRGARDSILEGNYFALTQPLPVNGNAVEFATSGNNNMVIGNVMTAYAITSMTVGSGTGHIIRDNDISFNGGPGASFGGSGHVIQNNNISDNGDTAVSLGGSLQRFEGNRVLRNGGIGISITSNNSQGNTITRNSIADNGGLGIDLAPAGVNANDLAADCADGFPDCDAGPNGRQNFPVLNAAASVWSASGVFLSGSLASRPSQTYTIEFFASRAANPSGHGEGEVYLGSIDVTTDATGNALFTASLPLGNPLGDGTSVGHFTATATDPTGATSEFSQAIQLAR